MRRIISSILLVLFSLLAMPLVLGASWSAYVFDADSGLGIDAVNVTAVRSGTGIYLNSTLTNSSGFFNISIPKSPLRLVSSKTGYLNDTSQVLPPITDDRVLQFNITLIKDLPGNITGRVTDDSGNALASATVEALQASIIKGSDITDINGNYIISNLRDGTYTVKITTGSLTQNITNVVVLPASTTELNFTLVLAPVSSTVPSAQASQPAPAVPEKGGSPCPPSTELIERKCVATKKAEEVHEAEEAPTEEEIPEAEEAGGPAEEQLQPPAITGAAVAEPKQVIPLAAGVLLAYILVFVLLLFLMNPGFRVMVYRKLKTYSKNMLRKK